MRNRHLTTSRITVPPGAPCAKSAVAVAVVLRVRWQLRPVCQREPDLRLAVRVGMSAGFEVAIYAASDMLLSLDVAMVHS